MKSVVYKSFSSGNEVIETIVEAIPKNDDSTVLIKVEAVSINPLDWKVKKGDVKILSGSKFPKHIAVDFSGTIQAVGAKVTSFSAGDEVFGCVSDVFKNGALSEFIVVDTKVIYKKPSNISFQQAASSVIAGVTAYDALQTSNVKIGTNLLVLGATGGVGMFAVQLAKERGAIVTGLCSTQGIPYAEKWGCDEVVDYKTNDIATMPSMQKKFDVILDASAKYSFNIMKKLLKPTAVYVDLIPAFDTFISSPFRNLFCSQQLKVIFAIINTTSLKAVADSIANGKVDIHVSTFQMVDVREALDLAQKGGFIGKITVKIDYEVIKG
jgi:NADPH:quinone reductase-like Zn-dependent oxidoreductase